jgi:hypothetical protein
MVNLIDFVKGHLDSSFLVKIFIGLFEGFLGVVFMENLVDFEKGYLDSSLMVHLVKFHLVDIASCLKVQCML